MIGKLHHIGYAVKDVEKAAGAFYELGYCKQGEPVYDELRKVNILFLESDLGPLVELVAPVEEGNPVAGILQKSGAAPYHLCYETPDIDRTAAQLKEAKYVVMGKAMPAGALNGNRVQFLYHAKIGIIELLEV